MRWIAKGLIIVKLHSTAYVESALLHRAEFYIFNP